MNIHFPRLYRYERKQEHCSVALPFPEGKFRDGMHVQILDQDRELPVQTRVTSRYPDGSVRYAFVRFTADLPANRGKELQAELREGSAPEYSGIRVERSGDTLNVDGGMGGLQLTVRDGSRSLVECVCDGRKTYRAEQFLGPVLKDGESREWKICLSEWRVAESGPLVARLRCRGIFVPETVDMPEERPSFEVTLTLYAGKPWMEAGFRLINSTSAPLKAASLVFALMDGKTGAWDPAVHGGTAREKGDSVGEGSTDNGRVAGEGGILRTTGIKMLPQLEEKVRDAAVRCCVGSSNYKTNFTVSRGESVERVVDTAYLMSEANEHFIEVFYGTLFADRTDRESGVCATIYQAQQNYPKAVKSDASGVYVMLVPEHVEEVVLQGGMSREQCFQLHFHGPEESLAEVDNRSLLYQMPDRPWVDAELFRDAGVASDIFLDPDLCRPEVEARLISLCDAHSRSFGMLNFGDAPDPNYTRQGRGRGKLVWTNNEYDFPHACALLYMRTGERRFQDYLIAAARHWMDVDVCHYSKDPLLVGGQWEHCRSHVLDSTMVCSHEWVEGLLDLYHFTGDERALETALGIGENVLRLLDTPAYQVSGESNARETGWALRSLTALYVETGDPKWVQKADWIVAQFRDWMDTYGSWVAPYTDNTLIHVGFMIAVAMGSLARYYRVFPREDIRQMLLAAADDLLESCMTRTGLFIYKELPSLNRLGNNTLLLEAFTIAYELSGDLKYLRAGLPTFRGEMAGRAGIMGEKKVMEGTVILENDPPKHFAQCFIPLSVYYKKAAETGVLDA